MSETESFEASLCELMGYFYDNSYATRLCERIRRAHDREIRDVSQQQYNRGFHAGQHSMDAEHRVIAMRLRQLPLDGGSYENLRRIAYAIYPCATGWKCESADGLRDRLVDLMGGVSDENVHVGGLRCVDGCRGDVSNGEDTGRTYDAHSNRDRNHMAVREGVDSMIGDSDDTCDSQCRGACAADCGRDSGKHAEVSDDCVDCDILGPDSRGHAVGCDFHELGVSDGRTADDSPADSRGGSGSELVHMDGLSTYDVLWNERQKAVCALRKLPEWYKDDGKRSPDGKFNEAIGDAIGIEGLLSFAKIRDRLIHLLGGDQPSGIDVLRAMDAESDVDGTCPNDVPTMSQHRPSPTSCADTYKTTNAST